MPKVRKRTVVGRTEDRILKCLCMGAVRNIDLSLAHSTAGKCFIHQSGLFINAVYP